MLNARRTLVADPNARNYEGWWAADLGQPVLNVPKGLVADLSLQILMVYVVQIWGSPALYVRRNPLVADLLAKSKVDVLQIWAARAQSPEKPLVADHCSQVLRGRWDADFGQPVHNIRGTPTNKKYY
jgi:hypothetical protein